MRTYPLFVLLALLCFPSDAALGATRRRALRMKPLPCAPSFATAHAQVVDIATDASDVYFGDARGNLLRVAKDSGESTQIAAIPNKIIYFLALDATNVYFETLTALNTLTSPASLYSVPKSGGTPVLLLENINNPYDMEIDGDWVYVVAAGTRISGPNWNKDGRIVRVSTDGTKVETLASGLHFPTGIEIDGQSVYFTEFGVSQSDTANGVRKMAKNGGEVTVVATIPYSLALERSGTTLYVARLSGSDVIEIDSVSTDGGSVTPLVFGIGIGVMEPMEAFAGSLYFLNVISTSTSRIEAIPLGGGDRRTVRQFPSGFAQFAIDECGIYYSTPAGVERGSY